MPQRKRSSLPATVLCCLQEGLKAAVWHAPAGTGDVERIIKGAPFKPGARGFTSLLQLVSRDRSPKAWQKAMEVRQAMRDRPDLHPNTITYSVSLAAQKLWNHGQATRARAAARTTCQCVELNCTRALPCFLAGSDFSPRQSVGEGHRGAGVQL